jgi:NAD(P)-dependent dehydrogenase (short-subunit alcohol dehydrogenase family)
MTYGKGERMSTLSGTHVAILGGGSGIGLAAARLAQSSGARVTIGGRSRERLDAALGSLGGDARGLVVDATDPASLRRFFAEAGRLDHLVLTMTRRGGAGPVAELADADLPGAFAGKPIAHLHAIALALPTLAERGSVVLVTAASAQAALPGTVGLAAVNGALEAAVPPLAVELAPRRVNAVSPGVIETEWWHEVPEADRQALFATYAEQAPVGRNGSADDVAAAIASLLENGFLTGVVLPCDGGLRLAA